jgi:hypothetical protein
VRNPVRGALWRRTGNRTDAVDLGQHAGLAGLREREHRRARDLEPDVERAASVVDHDEIAGSQTIDVTEHARRPARTVDMAGDHRGADDAGNRAPPVPEGLFPDRVVDGSLRRIHHIVGGDPDAEHLRAHANRRYPELQRDRNGTGADVETLRVQRGRNRRIAQLSSRGAQQDPRARRRRRGRRRRRRRRPHGGLPAGCGCTSCEEHRHGQRRDREPQPGGSGPTHREQRGVKTCSEVHRSAGRVGGRAAGAGRPGRASPFHRSRRSAPPAKGTRAGRAAPRR